MSGVNIPSIPATVDPNVRQAINELKARIVALQAQVVTLERQTTSTTTTSTTASGVVSEAPQDDRIYVRRNGQWEVLYIT